MRMISAISLFVALLTLTGSAVFALDKEVPPGRRLFLSSRRFQLTSPGQPC